MLQMRDELADLERRLDELDRAMTRAELALASPDNTPAEIAALERSLGLLRSAFSELVRESMEDMRARRPPAFSARERRPAAKRH
jgi:hypothetical protein